MITVLCFYITVMSFYYFMTLFCFLFQVLGGTDADLSVRAKKSQLYVCRVNDLYGNYVFSDWVKVKVLDIDKSGTVSAVLFSI